MNSRKPFSRAAAERRHGPAGVAAVRRKVDAAPPLRPELYAQLLAVFTSAPVVAPQKQSPAAEAA